MQPGEDLDACLTAQAPPQEDGARNRGDVLRIRIALTLGTFVLAGCAIVGTALADTSSSPTIPAPATTAPVPPSQRVLPTTTTRPAPEPPRAPAVTPSRGPGRSAPVVPRAIPAGPTGDLHLPTITDGN
jgi:hypothetical protein